MFPGLDPRKRFLADSRALGQFLLCQRGGLAVGDDLTGDRGKNECGRGPAIGSRYRSHQSRPSPLPVKELIQKNPRFPKNTSKTFTSRLKI